MKILIIHPQMSYYGGAELLIVKLANYLIVKGNEVKILSLKSSEEVAKECKAEIISPKNSINISSKGFESAYDLLKGIILLRKMAKRMYKDFDVINFHNFPSTWSLYPRHKPCVWMLNEPPNLWSRPDPGIALKIINKIRNFVDRHIVSKIDVICVSDEFNRQRCLARYRKDPIIVNYGIDHAFFSKGKRQEAIKKYGFKNKFIIVQSGVLSPQKNQLESIKAVEKLKDKIKEVLLVLAGNPEPEYESSLKAYVREKGLEKYVLFTGNLKREDLRDIYAVSHAAIFPIKSQGGWLAPFEALSASIPIVVSKEFTASSLIRQNGLGYVTKNYDAALLDIFKNKNKKQFKSKTKRASLFVKNNLSWQAFGDKLIDAYNKAMKL